MNEQPLKIAVVGAGVAGLTAAWLLNRQHRVHLFEKNDYLGGHTRTLTVPEGPDSGMPVDTGFIVMNHRNYPLFTRVLEQLRVPLGDSCMSFSFHCRKSGYAYAGTSLGGLFANPGNVLNPAHWAMIKDIRRFGREARRELLEGQINGDTLKDYLDKNHYSKSFMEHYLFPMGSAIWSSPLTELENFPAQPYLHFFENHGLLALNNRPAWRYVEGGSRRYIEAMLKGFKQPPGLSSPPQSIRREEGNVRLTFKDRPDEVFDRVVIGTHADEALKLLADPAPEERDTLGTWKYQDNEVVLHTDTGVMPEARRAWASWNFSREESEDRSVPVSVSYHMNRLQRLQTQQHYFVTLNRQSCIPEEHVINRTMLTHPLYTFGALASQPRIQALNGSRNTYFCGSYLGYGFHEDAVRSAVEVAGLLGVAL